jgi:hypothetical protein
VFSDPSEQLIMELLGNLATAQMDASECFMDDNMGDEYYDDEDFDFDDDSSGHFDYIGGAAGGVEV